MFQNPLLIKELRCRLRGTKSFILLTIYVAILAILLGIVYKYQINRIYSPIHMSSVGKGLFYSLATVQLAAIGLIGSVLTASSITVEKEKQTLEMLLITLLSPFQIVFGKLFSVLLFIFILLLLSLPLASMSFMLGGISPPEVLLSYSLLIESMLLYGLVGYLCSAYFKQTRTAASIALGITLGLSIGPLLIFFLFEILRMRSSEDIIVALFFPFSSVAGLISVSDTGVFSSEVRHIWGTEIPLWILHFIYSSILLAVGGILSFKKFNWIKRSS